MTPPRRVRVSAPVRLDFAGGWTDVAPYATDAGGMVVNAAIDLRTTVTIDSTVDDYRLESHDQGLRSVTRDPRTGDAPAGLQLHRAALQELGCGPCAIRSHAVAPAGSGLGTSGALGVALVAASAIFSGGPLAPDVVAHRAWELETIGAAVAGGKQDQYAAALGGFQRLTFLDGYVKSEAIAVDPDVADALAAHILVCHTGRSRFSGSTISRVMDGYRAGDAKITAALNTMAAVAATTPEVLRAGDLPGLGRLLQRNWTQQLQLDPAMRTDAMARLEAAVAMYGAIGGKAAGSGAGGVMFFVVPGDTTAARAAATAAGATVLSWGWASAGVRHEPDARGIDRDPV